MTAFEIAVRLQSRAQTEDRLRKAQKLALRSGILWIDVETALKLHDVQQAVIDAHAAFRADV